MLLDRMVGDRGRSGDSSEGSIDELKKWANGITSDGEHLIERRSALVRATVAWWRKSRNGGPSVRALCVALMPGFDYSVTDPGIGKTVTRTSQMLGDDELRALVELLPEVLNVVRESERVPWRELFDLVQTWLTPQARFFPPVKFDQTTGEILSNFASTMLEGMAGVSRRHPGVQHRIGELARDIAMLPELSLHAEFEVLFPSESLDPEDWQRQHQRWSDAVTELAHNWSNRSLEDFASLLKWCEFEADLAGIDSPRLSLEFCAHLAARVSGSRGSGRSTRESCAPECACCAIHSQSRVRQPPRLDLSCASMPRGGRVSLERGGDGVGRTSGAKRSVRRRAFSRR